MNLTQISGSVAIFGSFVITFLFALPSLIGAIKQSSFVRGVSIFVSLAALIIGYEILAVKTGLAYGQFSYGNALSPRLLNTVPVIITLTYPPLVIGAYWLARKISVGILIPIITALLTAATYTVIAPILLKLEFWQWETAGRFYGVHIRAFAGWFICALIAGFIINALWGENSPKRLSAYSWMAILLFWGGANIGVSNMAPGLIGICSGSALLVLFVLEKRNENK